MLVLSVFCTLLHSRVQSIQNLFHLSLIRLLSLSVYILDKTGSAENKVKSL